MSFAVKQKDFVKEKVHTATEVFELIRVEGPDSVFAFFRTGHFQFQTSRMATKLGWYISNVYWQCPDLDSTYNKVACLPLCSQAVSFCSYRRTCRIFPSGEHLEVKSFRQVKPANASSRLGFRRLWDCEFRAMFAQRGKSISNRYVPMRTLIAFPNWNIQCGFSMFPFDNFDRRNSFEPDRQSGEANAEASNSLKSANTCKRSAFRNPRIRRNASGGFIIKLWRGFEFFM